MGVVHPTSQAERHAEATRYNASVIFMGLNSNILGKVQKHFVHGRYGLKGAGASGLRPLEARASHWPESEVISLIACTGMLSGLMRT